VPDGDFVFIGGGWGHGAGMSQYGAMGAGRLGCTAEQILTTYFPGTVLGSRPMPDRVVIGLASSLTSTEVTASAGTIPWELCHYQTAECTDLPVTQPTGAVWRIEIRPDATYRITESGQEVWAGGDFELNLRAALSSDDATDRRVLVGHTGHTYRWGVLQFDSVARNPADAVVTVEIPSMELYLRGLSEVPASWPAATLQAQAVSGRSYAMRKIAAAEGLAGGLMDKSCRCHLVDTPADQNYEGYDYERADAQGGANWRAAVEGTAGQVLLHDGEIAQTFYSSSHGGHSESTAFVFGGALPYAVPVDDSRWDLASTNPLRRWTVAYRLAPDSRRVVSPRSARSARTRLDRAASPPSSQTVSVPSRRSSSATASARPSPGVSSSGASSDAASRTPASASGKSADDASTTSGAASQPCADAAMAVPIRSPPAARSSTSGAGSDGGGSEDGGSDGGGSDSPSPASQYRVDRRPSPRRRSSPVRIATPSVPVTRTPP
jgi:SpoIID/LytB domain protein